MSEPVRRDSPEFTPCSFFPMTPAGRRKLLLREVDVMLDVGANRGQYASWIRSLGFDGRIISFEPQGTAFQTLSAAAMGDDRWECHRLALGSSDVEAELHLAHESEASSVFQPTFQHLRGFPHAVRTGTERVSMQSLSSVWRTLDCKGGVYLKVDVEGFELSVLEGAVPVLDRIEFVELELSVAGMYREAPLFHEVLGFLLSHDFAVVAIEQNGGDDHASGQQLMCDGILRRVRPAP